MTSAGVAAGIALTFAVTPRFAATMAGVGDRPVAELIVVTLVLAAIALLANVLPVWRAAGVAPMDVLRDE